MTGSARYRAAVRDPAVTYGAAYTDSFGYRHLTGAVKNNDTFAVEVVQPR